MYIQTQKTPNPNSLKFIPGKNVSKIGSIEIHDKSETDNVLLKSIFDINGVNSIFLDETFLTINKREENNWEDIKHIILSLLNDYYINGKETILDKQIVQKKK